MSLPKISCYVYYYLITVVLFFSCQKRTRPVFRHHTPSQIDSLYNTVDRNSDPQKLKSVSDSLLAMARDGDDRYALLKASMHRAAYYWAESYHDSAMYFAVQALKLSDTLHRKADLPMIMAYIANIQKEKNNYPSALDAMHNGLRIAQELRDTAQIIYLTRVNAMIMNSYGYFVHDSVMREKAYKLHQEGLALSKTNPKYESQRMNYYTNMSQYQIWKGHYEKALQLNDSAVALGWKYGDYRCLSLAYNWIGEAYIFLGQFDKGTQNILLALKVAKERNYVFRVMEIYEDLAKNFQNAGKYREALDYYQRYADLHDSLRILDNVRQVSQLTASYELGKKQQQIYSLTRTTRQSYIWIGTLGIVLSVIVIFLVILWRLYRKIFSQKLQIQSQAEKLQYLIRELHHRIKNNLQIVSSLLSLQSAHIQDEKSKALMRTGQQRIAAMSLIHRHLYEQDDIAHVDLKSYVGSLLALIRDSFGFRQEEVDLAVEVTVATLHTDMTMPIGLIINEWMTNSFKYAVLPNCRPVMGLVLIHTTEKNRLLLQMRDNGPGVDIKKWENAASFGHRLIIALAGQLHATWEIHNDHGAVLTLYIPVD